MSKAESIRKLFDSADPSGETWWRDGLFNEDKWTAKHRHILFMLKEPSREPRGKCDSLVTSPNIGDLWWRPLCLWSYAALHTTSDRIPSFQEAMASNPGDTDHETGRSVAMMNLKKVSGGPEAEMKSVRKWAENQSEFLDKQFHLIKPNLVICCGSEVWSIARQVLSACPAGSLNRYAILENRLWVDLRHPVRSTYSLSYYALAGITHTALTDPLCPAELIAGESSPSQAGPAIC